MRVLYIASGDYKYGASKSMMSLILYLKEHYDVEPVLLTKHRNKLNEICDEKGIENYSCWYGDFMSGAPYSFVPLKITKYIVKYFLYLLGVICQDNVFTCGIDFNTIDIVHTNHNRIQLGAYISRKKFIPHIWHIREFGKDDYNVVFYRPNTIKYMNQHADKFIAISDAVNNCWVRQGIFADKITTVYNGLERDRYVPKKKRDDNKLKLVITGHIQPSKGQLQLVKAITLLPAQIRNCVQLDIIGEGYKDYIFKIKRIVSKYSLTNVNFLGYCDNVPEKLSEYDVGVICSRAEGFGRVTVEYMLAGLYVIATKSGANPEIIQDIKHGMLYDNGDISMLTECIKEVYMHRKKYCSIDNSMSLFSMDMYASGIFSVYKEILKGKTNEW